MDPEPLIAEEWASVKNRRIVFAHQSVGQNILDGVEGLAADSGIELGIVEGRETAPEGTEITHFRVGKNGEPASKIDDFAAAVEAGVTEGRDVAMLKFCYVDITEGTDTGALAEQYLSSLERLQAARPETTFIGVTVPLRTVQSGPKAIVKKVLGRAPAGYEANLRRFEFNEQLREWNSGRLFDLATIESRSTTFQHRGRRAESLHPSLTSDGGHLNTMGSRVIATALLRHLAQLDVGTPQVP